MLVSWNTTNACNLNCRHCYRDAGHQMAEELSTDEAMGLIDEIALAGFKIMIFSGGEPLIREDIFDLVGHAKSRGLVPVLGSNGTLITPEAARRLKEAGARCVGISLDSTIAGEHDQFRGEEGAWQGAVSGMRACAQAGLAFQVHTTAMRWNVDRIVALTDWAVAGGAQAHHIFFLVPTGRGASIEKEILPDHRYEQLLRELMQKQQEVPIELKPTCAPQFVRVVSQLGLSTRFSRGCLAGLAYCIINPRGDVQPCAYLDMPVDNVRRTPFSRIWRENPVFATLRTQKYGGRCQVCDFQSSCGGCRARAYYQSGDFMAQDDSCLYKRAVNDRGDARG